MIVPEIDDRNFDAELFEELLRRVDGGLRVQRVKHRLDEQQVRAGEQQCAGSLAVSREQIVEADVAKAGIVHIRRQRSHPIRGTQRPGHEDRPAIRRGILIGDSPRDGRGAIVELRHQRFGSVVRLRGSVGCEGIGLDDVRARVQIGAVNARDQLRTGENQDVGVALELPAILSEAFPPEVRLAQLLTLHHGAHCAIEQDDALRQQLIQPPDALAAQRLVERFDAIGQCGSARSGLLARTRLSRLRVQCVHARRTHVPSITRAHAATPSGCSARTPSA